MRVGCCVTMQKRVQTTRTIITSSSYTCVAHYSQHFLCPLRPISIADINNTATLTTTATGTSTSARARASSSCSHSDRCSGWAGMVGGICIDDAYSALPLSTAPTSTTSSSGGKRRDRSVHTKGEAHNTHIERSTHNERRIHIERGIHKVSERVREL